MGKLIQIAGRSALTAILAVSMVPTMALAQDGVSGESTNGSVQREADNQAGLQDAGYPSDRTGSDGTLSTEERIESIAAECDKQGFATEYDKALWLHDWLVENCEHDDSASSSTPDLLLATGEGTDAAYAGAYEMLLDKMGIQGKRMTAEGREWNAVKLDGSWCLVDVALDDDFTLDGVAPLSDEEKTILQHRYFGMNDDLAALVHGGHKAQQGLECPTVENHYLAKSGYAAKWADGYAEGVAAKIAAGESSFTVQIKPEVLGSALSAYSEILNMLIAWDLSSRDWPVAGASTSAVVKYQPGDNGQPGVFSIELPEESEMASLDSGNDGAAELENAESSGNASAGSSGSSSAPESSMKPAPVPEKAKPGLAAHNGSYRYGKPNGTYAKSEWVTVNGKWYYFKPDGIAAKWETKIGDYWYYFNGNCQMVTGWVTWRADGTKSYFGKDGKALVGLQKIGGATYYFDPLTAHSRKWEVRIGGDLYYFNGKYQMVTGWVTWNNDKTKSYFASNGKALRGLQKVGNATYYFDPATCRSRKWEQRINGDLYYFNGKYQMVTGWVTWNDDKTKSYFASSGKALRGFQKVGSATYYFDPSTCRSKKWEQCIGSDLYYFNGKYQMVTGLVTWKADGTRSVFASNGKMVQSGFAFSGGSTYYVSPSTHRVVKWTQVINGATYYFDGNGRMHTGWLQWNADKTWSYFYSNGKMAMGTQTIDGTRYEFGASGKISRKQATKNDLLSALSGLGGSSSVRSFGPSSGTGASLRSVQDAVAKINGSGAEVEFVMIDLATGSGLSYRATSTEWVASAIKAPYIISLARNNPQSINGWKGSIRDCLIDSDNSAYWALRSEYGSLPFRNYAGCCRASIDTSINYPDVSPKELAKLWVGNYWYLFKETNSQSSYLRGLLGKTQMSFIREALGSKKEVLSKPGWNLTGGVIFRYNDAGIVMDGSHPYVLAVLSHGNNQTANLKNLVSAIDRYHGSMF